MAKNAGKAFEEDFAKSVPTTMVLIRLKDGGGWSNAENTRFTPKNECDCILYDGNKFLMLEMKSHLGKSIPKSVIKESQVKSLMKQAGKVNSLPGIVFNFRDLEETYFIDIEKVSKYYFAEERASFPIAWVRENGTRIIQQKKKVRYKYDVEGLLQTLIGA